MENNNKIVIRMDLGKYKYIDLSLDEAIEFINQAIKVHGETTDLSETLRFLKNFDEFYRYMQKKFKDFITPPKSSKELVLGKVFVHKVKLYVNDSGKRVLFVIDKRIDLNKLKNILAELGYNNVLVEKELF